MAIVRHSFHPVTVVPILLKRMTPPTLSGSLCCIRHRHPVHLPVLRAHAVLPSTPRARSAGAMATRRVPGVLFFGASDAMRTTTALTRRFSGNTVTTGYQLHRRLHSRLPRCARLVTHRSERHNACATVLPVEDLGNL